MSVMNGRNSVSRWLFACVLLGGSACGGPQQNASTGTGGSSNAGASGGGSSGSGASGGNGNVDAGSADAGPPRGPFTIGTPTDPGAWGGTPVIDAKAPAIVYPSDQTRFPRNIYRTLFQWRRRGYDAVPPDVQGPGTTVTVYTDGEHAAVRDAHRRGLLGGRRAVLVPHRRLATPARPSP